MALGSQTLVEEGLQVVAAGLANHNMPEVLGMVMEAEPRQHSKQRYHSLAERHHLAALANLLVACYSRSPR